MDLSGIHLAVLTWKMLLSVLSVQKIKVVVDNIQIFNQTHSFFWYLLPSFFSIPSS